MDELLEALRAIVKIASDRQAFVMEGPRAFARAERIAQEALDAHARSTTTPAEADGKPISEAERAARCAWLVFLEDARDGLVGPSEAARTFHALPDNVAKAAHAAWRRKVGDELERLLQSFCPGGDEGCCSKECWPENALRSHVHDEWVRIGKWCSTGRRSLWMRVVFRKEPPLDEAVITPINVEAIELKAGREGRDAEVRITHDNPQFGELLDLFLTAHFAATT